MPDYTAMVVGPMVQDQGNGKKNTSVRKQKKAAGEEFDLPLM